MNLKGRILIADDEPTFRHALADLLREEGFECQVVESGAAAAAELNTGQYDLLIADIMMPGNPQLELIRHLPQIAEGVPAILVTGYPTPQSRIASAGLPVLSYMVKPVDFDQLLVKVRLSVTQALVRRTNDALSARLNEWAEECRNLSGLMARGSPGAAGVSGETLLKLSLRHMLGCLNELDDMWRHAALIKRGPATDRPASEGADGPSSVAAAPVDPIGHALLSAMRAFEAAGGNT